MSHGSEEAKAEMTDSAFSWRDREMGRERGMRLSAEEIAGEASGGGSRWRESFLFEVFLSLSLSLARSLSLYMWRRMKPL